MRSDTLSTLATGLGGQRAKRRTRPAAPASPRAADRRRPASAAGVVPVRRTAGAAQIASASKGQAVESHQGAALHQPDVLAERHAGGCSTGNPVNRWPRSHSLTVSAGRKGEDAGGVAGPEQPRQGEAEGREKRQQSRQAENAERERPGELIGLDQKSRAEPPQAGDEIAEAPAPADERRRS